MDADAERYCREIESYLCRKNEGHLIRIVGPSFDLVSRWAAQGLPLKIALSGIDRYFERRRDRSRRRFVRIEFCEADVLDAFDEWRRAIGLPAEHGSLQDRASAGEVSDRGRSGPTLPAHLERALMRLTRARASGALSAAFDDTIDRVARELDTAKATIRGIRGSARETLIGRLAELDAELLRTARASIDEASSAALVAEADSELARFRDRMAEDAFTRAREAAVSQLIRQRFALPVISFS